jgi:hypothetical protein
VGDAGGELTDRCEATRGDEATAQTRDLAQVARHQDESDREVLFVAKYRGRDGNRERSRVRHHHVLFFLEGGAGSETQFGEQLGDRASLERSRVGAGELRHSGIDRADAAVEAHQGDAVGQDPQDLGCEGAGYQKRVAVAMEAPRDRRAEEGERGGAESRRLVAEERQQGVGCRRHHQRHRDPEHQPARLPALPG